MKLGKYNQDTNHYSITDNKIDDTMSKQLSDKSQEDRDKISITGGTLDVNALNLELPKVPSSDIDINSETNEMNEASLRRSKLRKTLNKKLEVDDDCDDMLFLRSILPYMASLPLVQKLKLRGEINNAIMKVCGKKNEKEDHDPKE
ncbi:hypothetical protein O3M35_000962 [Rhynocoris fuscipes]|uniref:BESS domain-containing protein n=1 Tax=Rhynocoris fuscipes TaxID=488301 RepID=A0AAW1DTM0_9HEMI